MNNPEIEKFIANLPSKEHAAVIVLHNAVNATLKKYNKSRAASDLKDWQAAEACLADTIQKLTIKYGVGSGPATLDERRFKNMTEVVEYLNGQGWKIGSSKGYTDRKAGRITARPDGSFLMSDVDRYIIKAELKKADGTDPATDNQSRKTEAEIEKLEAAAELLKLKAKIESGKYVPREQMEQELAARASYLRTDFENFGQAYAAEMVAIVDGDPGKTAELLDFYLNAAADWMDRYAKQPDTARTQIKDFPEPA